MQNAQSALGSHTLQTTRSALDTAVADLLRLQEHGPQEVMPRLSERLDDVRRELDDVRRWNQFCADVLHAHPIRDLFLEDPFTRHSASQPRGYPGDAELLDYIYRLRGTNGASRLGKALFDYTTNVQSSAAVRERRTLMRGTSTERQKCIPLREYFRSPPAT